MNEALLQIYHRLPSPMRSWVATARGLALRQQRYGPETERLVQEALERERWSSVQWREWQTERLRYILHRAVTRVPYYREYWANRKGHGTSKQWEDLSNWPILEKEVVRAKPRAFLAEDCTGRRLFQMHTSGTTGTPLVLWKSRDTERAWYALFEARWRRWYGVSRQDRWAILGGQLVTPVQQRRPPFWVWNAGLRQLYMSVYHLACDLVPHYLEALKKYRVRYLWGYTSALYALAEEVVRSGRQDLKMTVVITNAEPVFDYQRQTIAQAFQCPVRETYGMAEAVAGASECECGRLHLWPEAGVLEVVEDGQAVSPGAIGDFVCTGLVNGDMPLIRYRVGDRGALAGRDEECPCQRTLPLLACVEGRCDDVIITPDGRRVGRLDPVFKLGLPIREAQIIQEAVDKIRVRVVPTSGYGTADAADIADRIQQRLGSGVVVEVEAVVAIERTRAGKFKAVVNRLPASEKGRVASPPEES